MKDKEYLPHRYKLSRSANRVPHPNQPRLQPDTDKPSDETQPKKVIEVTSINPPLANPNPRADPKEPNSPVPDYRAVVMDQQRIEEVVREMIR